MLYGPQQEKTCLQGVGTTKEQTSLHIQHFQKWADNMVN